MSLAAHTNAVGSHDQFDVRTEEVNGEVYDVASGTMVPFHDSNSYSQLIGRSTKPSPFHGDHKTSYDYGRGVMRVMEDKPYVLHDHYVNPVDGLTSNYDLYRNEFISKRHGPFGFYPVNEALDDNGWAQSINQALISLKGRSAEVGQALGELKPTVDMLAANVMRAANFLKHMKHGRWKEAANDLGISLKAFNRNRGKALANYWLEFSYGWRPLAQTMYDIQETFSAAVQRKSNLVIGKGTGLAQGQGSFPYGNWEESFDWTGSTHTVLKARLTNPKLALLNSLGLTNPFAIAWEVVPFSFVVDWFVPVGNTLDAMTAGQGLEWLGGQITNHINYEVAIQHKTGFITFWTDCVDGGRYLEKGFFFNRVALAGMPYAQLYADLTPYSTPRAVNALALVRQLT